MVLFYRIREDVMIGNKRQMERILKGVASHRRLQILELLSIKPDQAVHSIADAIDTDFRNTSQHLQKMVGAGLVSKQQQGNEVLHFLSPRGRQMLKLIRSLV